MCCTCISGSTQWRSVPFRSCAVNKPYTNQCWDGSEAEWTVNNQQHHIPSSACFSHSTNGFSRSSSTAFPLPSLNHFRIASSLNTSAARNNKTAVFSVKIFNLSSKWYRHVNWLLLHNQNSYNTVDISTSGLRSLSRLTSNWNVDDNVEF